jgi:exodeoxyribonuclease V alpha subunit
MSDDRMGLEAAQRAVMRLLRDRFAVDDEVVLRLAGLVMRAVGRGHTGIDLSRPAAELVRLLDVPDGSLEDLPPRDVLVEHLRRSAAVGVVGEGDEVVRDRPLVLDGLLLGTERTHRLEHRVLAAIQRRRAAAVDDTIDRVAAAAALAQPYPDQELAVRTLLRTNRSAGLGVLVGGPGTGKTHTVATLLAALQAAAREAGAPPLDIALAAPTGKAAARLGESLARSRPILRAHYAAALGDEVDAFVEQVVGPRARTVHRLLGIGRDGVARRDDGPLAHDVVLVDEASMLDLSLTAELLDALDDGCRLFLVGDQFQLQSVGAGSVLQSLVDGLDRAGEPVATLTENRRLTGTADEEHVRFIDRLRAGATDEALAELDRLSARRGPQASLRLVETEDPTAQAAAVLDVLRGPLAEALARLETGAGSRAALDALDGARVLCAHRSGRWGVETWWSVLRDAVAAERGVVIAPGRRWLVGEPVLATVNDPQTGLSNGDTGVVVGSEAAPRFAFALADGTEVERAVVAMPDVESALAVTVHKSQGSEYAVVIVILPPEDSRLATRELLYTAVTRAKERVVLVGSRDGLRAAAERRSTRMGGLADGLARALPTSEVSG